MISKPTTEIVHYKKIPEAIAGEDDPTVAHQVCNQKSDRLFIIFFLQGSKIGCFSIRPGIQKCTKRPKFFEAGDVDTSSLRGAEELKKLEGAVVRVDLLNNNNSQCLGEKSS